MVNIRVRLGTMDENILDEGDFGKFCNVVVLIIIFLGDKKFFFDFKIDIIVIESNRYVIFF